MPKKDNKKDDAKPEAVDDQKNKIEQAKKDGSREEEAAKQAVAKQADAMTAVGSGLAAAFEPAPPKPPEPPKIEPPSPPPPPPEPPTLIKMGDRTFYNQVLLSTRGAGVQQVILSMFEEADRLGRAGEGRRGQPTKTAVPRPGHRDAPREVPALRLSRPRSSTGQGGRHGRPRGTVLHHLPLPHARRQEPRPAPRRAELEDRLRRAGRDGGSTRSSSRPNSAIRTS